MKNILLVGVGGQGVLLTSKLFSVGLSQNSFDVKVSEIHGMAQRGGSVSSQIRYGENILSPVIEKGKVDILLAFEKQEALRWINHLTDGGICIVNDFEILSPPIIAGEAEYPPPI